MSTSQTAAMLCGWGVKAGWLIVFVDKRVGGSGPMRAALVEFHQHAGERDTSDGRRRIPVGISLTSESRSRAVVKPPAVIGASSVALHVVVLVLGRELHPVAIGSRVGWCGQCVVGVSAEPRHAQTILVRLWSHRERRVFDRLPHAGDTFQLKIHPPYSQRGVVWAGVSKWSDELHKRL